MGQERHDQETEGVLAERHPAQHVEEQSREPGVAEARDPRAGEDPVHDREQRNVGPDRIEPARQRHDRQHEAGSNAHPVEQAT